MKNVAQKKKPAPNLSVVPDDTLSPDPVARYRGLRRRQRVAEVALLDVRAALADLIREVAASSGPADDGHGRSMGDFLEIVADAMEIHKALLEAEEAVGCIASPTSAYACETEAEKWEGAS